MTSSHSVHQLFNRLRMRQIALLLAIDEFGTLRAAAHQLGMSQPAATKMLGSLEETLGKTLFERKGRGLVLSPAGEVVMNTFLNMKNNVLSLKRELHELELGSAGKIYVGSIIVATPVHLAKALVELKKKYPLLSIEVLVDTSNHLIKLLREGSLDVVIGRVLDPDDPANGDCVFRPIGDEALSVVVACTHPLVKKSNRTIRFEQLMPYPWILQPKGSPLRELIEQEFSQHHLPMPRGVLETSSILTIMSLIINSQMVAIIPRSIAAHYAAHGILHILPYRFTHSLTEWGSLVYSGRTVGKITQDFLELLHAE